MKVIIETPFKGHRGRNVSYARKCMEDSLMRGESPFMSHLLYPQVLDDNIPQERELGIRAGFKWHSVADKMVVYTDLGISHGMQQGIANAQKLGLDVEYRKIKPN